MTSTITDQIIDGNHALITQLKHKVRALFDKCDGRGEKPFEVVAWVEWDPNWETYDCWIDLSGGQFHDHVSINLCDGVIPLSAEHAILNALLYLESTFRELDLID